MIDSIRIEDKFTESGSCSFGSNKGNLLVRSFGIQTE